MLTVEQNLKATINAGEETSWDRAEDRREIVLLITPRSGSTWLGDLMTKTGVLGFPEEYLNAECIPDGNRDLKARSETDYLRGCTSSRITPNLVFSIQATWGDVARLSTVDFFDFFRDAQYVWLRRRDILDQAISLYIAVETGRFHSNGSQDLDEPSSLDKFLGFLGSVRADKLDENIRSWTGHIISYEAQTEIQLSVRLINPVRMFYEDMIITTKEALQQIAELVQVEIPAVPDGSFSRLSGDLNREIRGAFLKRNRSFLNRCELIRPALTL